MKYCICGHKEFDKFVIEDIGFDHSNYPRLTEKIYSVCNSCSTIFRDDNNIRNPFDESYFRYSDTRFCVRRSARINELVSYLDLLYA